MSVYLTPTHSKGVLLGAADTLHDGHRHLLGFQPAPSPVERYVLLHVPAETLTEESFLSTAHAPNCLWDIAREVMHPLATWADDPAQGVGSDAEAQPPLVMPINSTADARRAFLQLPGQQAESLIPLLRWYETYAGGKWRFVLARFGPGAQQPLLVRYTPLDPGEIFVPGLVSHKGLPPVVGERSADKRLIVTVGIVGKTSGALVRYSDKLDGLTTLLPSHAMGLIDGWDRDPGYALNSDYWFGLPDVAEGLFHDELLSVARRDR